MLTYLNNDYMERTPFIMQANNRLLQLNEIYGKSTVYKCFSSPGLYNEITIHLNNLMLTFSEETLADVTTVIYGRSAFIRKINKAS